ncbi:MAG TPA: guanylate kinase [Saprospiraceae bacterium]|nr:guanylate kinase [Saprospiraceae bacterium]
MQQGKMIIFTAPSGAGKSTIVHHLLQAFPQLEFSISATTRLRRPHEENGKDYYFVSKEEFRAWIADGAFVEWEEVYEDQFYGTLRREIERIWHEGKHIVFDIDVLGATHLKEAYPDQSLAVFVKPPSYEILVERLIKRRTENEQSLKKRLERIKKELTYETKFDVVLLNDQLDIAFKEAEKIVADFIEVKAEDGNINHA